MKTVLRGFLVLALAACSSGGSKGSGAGTGGAGGDDTETGGTTGTGGKTATGGSTGTTGGSTGTTGGNTGTTGGSTGTTGGSTGTTGGSGGSGDGGSGGATGGSGGAATGGSGGGGGTSAIMGWYEAEAIPPNTKAPRSEVHVNPATACKTTPPKPGDNCQSGGGEVTWITEGRQGWLQFNQVAAPSDGTYDVTWWYHCGNNDNFGDKHCGGQTDPPTTPRRLPPPQHHRQRHRADGHLSLPLLRRFVRHHPRGHHRAAAQGGHEHDQGLSQVARLRRHGRSSDLARGDGHEAAHQEQQRVRRELITSSYRARTAPARSAGPVGQTLPHMPQLALSFLRSTQRPLQTLRLVGQTTSLHTPWAQP
jgi:hypothetical protein